MVVGCREYGVNIQTLLVASKGFQKLYIYQVFDKEYS